MNASTMQQKKTLQRWAPQGLVSWSYPREEALSADHNQISIGCQPYRRRKGQAWEAWPSSLRLERSQGKLIPPPYPSRDGGECNSRSKGTV